MGVTCACQKTESEEEIISRIMNSLALADIDSNSAYTEFQKCINENYELDYFLFYNYLQKIVGENTYANIQNLYFKNLSKIAIEYKNIKKIGIMIISLSKSPDLIKTELLVKHFFNFYYTENNIKISLEKKSKNEIDSSTLTLCLKELVTDIIDCNTFHCLMAFQEYMDKDDFKNVNDIWQNKRKKNLFINILLNFENMKHKFNINKNESPKEDDRNKFIFVDTVEDNNNQYAKLKHDLTPNGDNNLKKLNSDDEILRHARKYSDSVYDIKIINEFIELSFPQFKGDYMRNYLYDEYMKEKTYDQVCY